MEEEFSDNEVSDEEEEYSSEDKSASSDFTYIMSPATQETKKRMEDALPNPLRWLLGWPEILPTSTTESTGLRDAIQALLQKEKLGGHQKKRLRLMNEELIQRQNLGINLDLPFIKESEGTSSESDANCSRKAIPSKPTIPEAKPTIDSPTEPDEDLPTSSERIMDLRNEISVLTEMKRRLGGKQRKRLRELNAELAMLENPLTAIINLYPTSKEQAKKAELKEPQLSPIQGRFLGPEDITPGQRLPFWWENEEIQRRIQEHPDLYPPPPDFVPNLLF